MAETVHYRKIGRWGLAIGTDSFVCGSAGKTLWQYKLAFWSEDGCSRSETVASGTGLGSMSQARLLLARAIRLARDEGSAHRLG
jgi:hypothetical protein